MAEITLRDVIKTLKTNNDAQSYQNDENLRASQNISKEIATLNRLMKSYFAAQKAGSGDTLEDKREKRQVAAERQKSSNGPTTFKEGFKEGIGLDFLGKLASLPGSLLAGALGGTLASKLLPTFGKILGRTLLRGPLFAALAIWGEDLIKQGFESLTGGKLSDADAKSLNTVLQTTLIGSIFGKRGAIAGFVGGVVGESLERVFGITNDEKMKIMGFELPIGEQDFAVWGSTIATFFAPSLITSAITKAFSGETAPSGGKNGVGRDPKTGRFISTKNRAQFNKGFISRGGLGWGSILLALGSTTGGIIGDALGSQETGDALGVAFQAAGVGTMLAGPMGGVVTGLVALAAVGLGALGDWLRNRDADIRKAAFDKLKKYENLSAEELQNLSAEEKEKANIASVSALNEARRAAQLAISDAEKKAAEDAAEKARQIRKDTFDPNTANGIGTDQIKSLTQGAFGGNIQDQNKILKYLENQGFTSPEEIEGAVQSFARKSLDLKNKDDFNKMDLFVDMMVQKFKDQSGMTYADPNFELPSNGIGSKFSNWFLGKNPSDAYKNLLPPTPTAGATPIIIDKSTSTQGGTTNNSVSTTLDNATNPDFVPF